jgi:peptidoglycan/LPS O-acetylase OafA/YrhL
MSADGQPAATTLRPEIQLLRAFAVLAVVFNHLAPGLVPGGYIGVDVFFVISGYLISSHLLRELDRTGSLRLGSFWARRARRLLPASLLVLVMSAAATVLVVPATQWGTVMRQITASALYVQNWALAFDAQDYFASADSPSPVTHYWSLSLEEQFYLVWPLLALAAYVVGRRWGRPRTAVAAAFAVVVATSLVYSVVETAREPNAAYFVTPARMWQLGIGGLLAFLPSLTRGRHTAAAAAWLALGGSLWIFNEGTAAPGWIALIPVLAAAAVICSGDAFLASPPVAVRPALAAGLWVGAISYSLYLWHWPPIALVPYATGEPLTTPMKLVLLAGTLVLSWLSLRFVEDPVRTSPWLTQGPPRRILLPAVAGMAVVVLVGVLVPATLQNRLEQVAGDVESAMSGNDRCFAARAMANHCENPHRLRYLDSTLLTVRNDPTADPGWGEVCIQAPDDPEVETCEFGAPRANAHLGVALVGDSHARHWAPALDELARMHGWNVKTFLKGSCPANAAPLRTRNYPEYEPSCRQWNRDIARTIAEDPLIDVVVTSGYSRNYVIDGLGPRETSSRIEQGYVDLWRLWTTAEKEVIAVGDVPRMRRGDIPTCVADAASRDDPCSQESRVALTTDPMLAAVEAADDPDVVPVDLSRFFCSRGRCHAVIGGIVAYGDENHILGFFARTLAPYLYEQMRPALDPARPGNTAMRPTAPASH